MSSGPKNKIDAHLKYFKGNPYYIPSEDIIKRAKFEHISELKSGIENIKDKLKQYKRGKSKTEETDRGMSKEEINRRNTITRLEFFKNKSQKILKMRKSIIKSNPKSFKSKMRKRHNSTFKHIIKKKRGNKRMNKSQNATPVISFKRQTTLPSFFPSSSTSKKVTWNNTDRIIEKKNIKRKTRSLSNQKKKSKVRFNELIFVLGRNGNRVY